MKRFLTLVLCLAMMLSLGMSAFAEAEVENAAPEAPVAAPEAIPETAPEAVPEEAPADEADTAPVVNPLQAVVIAIEAPATLRHLANGERVPVSGESEAYGGTVTLTEAGVPAYILDKWVNYFRVAGEAMSKYEGSEIFAEMYKMGTILEVAVRGSDTSTVIVNGVEAEIENRFLLFADQVPYTEWTGYTKVGIGVYDNPWLRGQPEKFPNKNTEYKVIADMGNCFLVNSGDYFGYIAKGNLMTAPKIWHVDEPVHGEHIGPEWTPPTK